MTSYWVTPQLGFGPCSSARTSGARVIIHLHDVKTRDRLLQRSRRFPMVDGALPDQAFLDDVVQTISGHLAAGRKVLVCCEEGRNRSALIVGLVLEKEEGLTGQPLVDRLVHARLAILTNRHFRERLLRGPTGP